MKRLLMIALAALTAACARAPDNLLQGYGEADYIYLSSQEPGVVAELLAQEGDQVQAGATVFRLEPNRLTFPMQGAAAQRGALAQAARAASADAALAQQNYARTSELFRQGFVARARLDADRAALDAASARSEEARRQLAASGADLGLLRERFSDLGVAAPAAGAIERIYHRRGEFVPAGQPVAALLPPENMKIRFFAPQAMLSRLSIGGAVTVTCDGCAAPLPATISFIAREPQFTPPIIYSLDQRAKLVFLVEARLADPSAIRPGMPVDVRVDAP